MEHENANRVFLLNRDGKPLMPCCPRKARLLLKSGKAFVVKKYPVSYTHLTLPTTPYV